MRLYMQLMKVRQHFAREDGPEECGMATAELLGNAALGIAALVAIWAVLQTLGLDIVDWMRGQLQV